MNRDTSIDFVKGAAIVLMVVGHAGPPVLVGKFIYLFHMAVFFMAAGYFFSPAKVSDWRGLRSFVWRRFKKLWGTYVFWSVLLILCHNLFIHLNIYTDNPEFESLGLGGYNHLTPYWNSVRKFCGPAFWSFFMMSTPHGAFWFLKVMLVSSIVYALVSYCVLRFSKHEMALQTVISLSLLLVGFYLPGLPGVDYLGGGGVVFTAYALLHLGRIMKVLMQKVSSKWIAWLAIVGFVALLSMLRLDRFELAANRFHSIPVLLLASLSGWFFLVGLHTVLSQMRVGKAMAYIGVRTLPILIFHFLAFKVVSALGVFAFGLPHFCIAASPVYFHGPLWCVAYAVAGVLIPLSLFEAYALCASLIRGRLA